jgi:hypothetical protein
MLASKHIHEDALHLIIHVYHEIETRYQNIIFLNALFIGPAYQVKDIVFRFVIEYTK